MNLYQNVNEKNIMTFPKIVFKKTNTEVGEELFNLIEKKLSVLDKYIGDETDVKCEVEFEKKTSQNSGEIYRTEVNFWLRGNLYRAEAVAESFPAGIDMVKDSLDYELAKKNDKKQTLQRKGEQKIKEAVLESKEV